jgi:hypothetical protein
VERRETVGGEMEEFKKRERERLTYGSYGWVVGMEHGK